MSKLMNYFSKSEIVLWIISVIVIIISFCVFDRTNYMTLCASLIGKRYNTRPSIHYEFLR